MESKSPLIKAKRKRNRRRAPAKKGIVREIAKLQITDNKIDRKELNGIRKDLSIMRANQRKLDSRLSDGLEPKYAKYLMAVSDPEHHMSKMPDSFTTAVALYKSVQVIPINIDFTTNPNGQFAIFLQPNIGTPAPSKDAFQVMVSNPGITDINDNSQYTYYSDPQADLFYSALGGEWAQVTTANVSPFGIINALATEAVHWTNHVSFQTIAANQKVTSSGSSLQLSQFEVPPSTFCNLIESVIPTGLYAGKNMLAPAGTWSSITGLSGWHLVSNYCIYPNSDLVTAQKVFFYFGVDPTPTNCTVIFIAASATDSFTNPAFASDYEALPYDQWSVLTGSNGQSLLWRENFYFNFDANKKYYISGSFESSAPPDGCTFTTTYTKCNAPPSITKPSPRFIPTLRPVAQSALLTNVSPKLYAGGTMACMSMVTGERQYFLQPGSENENYRKLQGLVFSGADENGRLNVAMKAEKGGYTFWKPYQRVQAPDLVDVDKLNATDNGGIAFVGNVPAQSNLSTVFFLKVVTLFEYTTQSRLIAVKPYEGDTGKMVEALNKLGKESIIFENPTHMSSLSKRILSMMCPLYGISEATGTDFGKNVQKFSDVASKLITAAPDASGIMDLLPVLMAAL